MPLNSLFWVSVTPVHLPALQLENEVFEPEKHRLCIHSIDFSNPQMHLAILLEVKNSA